MSVHTARHGVKRPSEHAHHLLSVPNHFIPVSWMEERACCIDPSDARMDPPIQTLNLRSRVLVMGVIFTLACSIHIHWQSFYIRSHE